MRTALTRLGAGIAVPALALGLVAAAAPAGAATASSGRVSGPVTSNRTLAAAGWLTTQLENSTHLPSPSGDHFDSYYGGSYYANTGENADVVFGLAAAKTGRGAISRALRYLAAEVGSYGDLSGAAGGPYDGAIGKTALAAEVAGANPRSFGGHDLLATLAADECTAATTSGSCSAPGAAKNIYSSVSESLVLLAEQRGKATVTAQAVTYFDSLQCSSGGFTSGTTACGTGAADVDSTSYAIMALTALGTSQTAELTHAESWLAGQQGKNGSWSDGNTNSTGLAAAALQGAKSSPSAVSSARHWLLTQQVGPGRAGAGALRFGGTFVPTALKSGTSYSVLATAQALTGLVNGGSLATVTAAGSSAGTRHFAPTSTVSRERVRRGGKLTISLTGFAAGERVRVAVRGRGLGKATVDASGLARVVVRIPRSEKTGHPSLVLVGTSSHLRIHRPLTVRR